MEYTLYIHIIVTALTFAYCLWRIFQPPNDSFWWAYPIVIVLMFVLSNLWFILWPWELISYARSVSTKFKPGDFALYCDKRVEVIKPERNVDHISIPIVWFMDQYGDPSFDYENQFTQVFDRHNETPLKGSVRLSYEGQIDPNGPILIDWREGDGLT